MKHINIVIIDGVERDMATLSAEERVKIVNELNRVAVGFLGYEREKTAWAVEGRTSMKRRGPRTKWQRIVREVVFDLLIGGAIGLAFDAVLFIWLFAK